MTDCKTVDTPLDQNFKFEMLARENCESKEIVKKCRQLIGSLLYAVSGSRPDLSVAVNFLSRYQHCASIALYKSLKRVLRYVKGTLDLSLVYSSNAKSEIVGFVDADWAADVKDQKSTSGFILLLFDCVVSWYCKK